MAERPRRPHNLAESCRSQEEATHEMAVEHAYGGVAFEALVEEGKGSAEGWRRLGRSVFRALVWLARGDIERITVLHRGPAPEETDEA